MGQNDVSTSWQEQTLVKLFTNDKLAEENPMEVEWIHKRLQLLHLLQDDQTYIDGQPCPSTGDVTRLGAEMAGAPRQC